MKGCTPEKETPTPKPTPVDKVTDPYDRALNPDLRKEVEDKREEWLKEAD
jgi:hypothetical protein